MSIRVHIIKKIEYGDTLACLHDWQGSNLEDLINYEQLNCDGAGNYDLMKDTVLELLKSEKLSKAQRAFLQGLD